MIKPVLAARICSLIIGWGMAANMQAARSEETPDHQDASALEEIVVTANRYAEPINKVPISIAAYSQDTLDKLGVRTVDDVLALTPGVDFSRGTEGFGLNTSISIRGISSIVGSATTGIYLDETPIQSRTLLYSSGSAYPIIFDLDRVEVLRGPQGTLFGAASEGGTVRFITPQPSLTQYSGYTRAELSGTKGSSDPSYEVGAAFGGPIISDVLGFRVSVYDRHDGGYIDRARYLTPGSYEKDSNYLDSSALRLALSWAPVAGLTVTPSVMSQQQHLNNGLTVWANLSNPADGRLIAGDPSDSTTRDRFTLSAVNAKWDAGPVSLYSNTSYYDRQNHSYFDYSSFEVGYFSPSGNPADYFTDPNYSAHSPQINSQQNFAQELRIQSTDPAARLTWVAGLYYSRSKQYAKELDNDPYFPEYFGPSYEQLFGGPLLNGETIYLDEFRDLDTERAVFGSATFSVTSKLKFTAGVRASHTHFNFTEEKNGPAAGGYSASAGSATDKPVTPKYSVSYQLDDNDLLYASAAKGYRQAGANAVIPSTYLACADALSSLGLKSAPLSYKSDSTWSYELGTKNRLADGRVQIDASIYYIQWNNIINDTLAVVNCPFTFTTNLGRALSRGFDFEGQWQVLDTLTVGASIGYNDSKYTETIRSAGASQDIVTEGHILGAVPWTLVGTAEYRFPGLIGKDTYIRSISSYHSQIRGPGIYNDPNYSTYDPLIPNQRSTFDQQLRAGVRFESGWDVSVFADNLLNRLNMTSYFRDAPYDTLFTYQPARPRTIGVTVSDRF